MDSEPKNPQVDWEAKFWQDMDEQDVEEDKLNPSAGDDVDDWLEAMYDMILMDEKHKNDHIDIETGNYILLNSDDEDEDGIELWEISRGREERCGRA
jgi:hypothetical protein